MADKVTSSAIRSALISSVQKVSTAMAALLTPIFLTFRNEAPRASDTTFSVTESRLPRPKNSSRIGTELPRV